jgi:hypothetical protein
MDDEKKLMLKLLNEILERLNGNQNSWLPGKKGYRKTNGAALAMLALILGILLGVVAAAILKGG